MPRSSHTLAVTAEAGRVARIVMGGGGREGACDGGALGHSLT